MTNFSPGDLVGLKSHPRGHPNFFVLLLRRCSIQGDPGNFWDIMYTGEDGHGHFFPVNEELLEGL